MEHILQIVKQTENAQLAHCPFCGNDDPVFIQYEHAAGPRWKVFCCSCCAEIDPGYAQNKYQVQALWNRRA